MNPSNNIKLRKWLMKIFTDRSRIIAREKCPRFRFLQYHEAGTGIVPRRTPLALGSVED